VSPVEGCEECDECAAVESGLMSMGTHAVGKLKTIVNPGGSIVSWPPELGSSPCTSLVSTCLRTGMVMVVVPGAPDLMVVMPATVASCIPPTLPSIVPPCSMSLRTGRWWYLPMPMDSHQEIIVAGVNPTAHPTPPSSF
jgi:hypothetical protein